MTKLIIGLGNPGPKYKNTWHNLGFLALDNFIKKNQLTKFKKDKKFNADVSISNLNSQKVILIKPLTFMNNSGQAVRAVMDYYKIKPANMMVVHDDIDLPLGKIRISHGSSAGGHNGVKSIIGCLGTKEFTRLRIGVATDIMEKVDTADYVLQKFGQKNKLKILKQIKKVATALMDWMTTENDRAL